MVAWSSQTMRIAVVLRRQAKGINPLLGGADAEGFGVGQPRRTHPGVAVKASQAFTPERGFPDSPPIQM
jgi:hypothetical protein